MVEISRFFCNVINLTNNPLKSEKYCSGKCECRPFCNTAGPTVCGTDNVSYLSECHLAVRSCIARVEEKSEIRVKQIGACGLCFLLSYFSIL